MKIKLISVTLALGFCVITYKVFDQLKENRSATSPYIFDADNLKKDADNVSTIHQIMGKYYEGVEKANLSLLEEVFHKEWFMRDTDTPNEATLNVEDKSTFIKRVKDHGPYPGYASERVFSTIGMANDNLAFVRINKDPSRSSTSFFLCKLENGWTIMDKVWVPVRDEETEPKGLSDYDAIEDLLHQYFTALATGDSDTMDKLLHDGWDSKKVDTNGRLEIISRSDLINNLSDRKELIDYSQLMSIDLYHNKLAIARIDMPSKSTSMFISMFSVDNLWTIVSERRSVKE